MPHSSVSRELRIVLGDWLQVRHLARPLQSIDLDGDSGAIENRLRQEGFSIAGVLHHNSVVGYVDLREKRCADGKARVHPLTADHLIDAHAPMLHLIARLLTRHWFLVRRGDLPSGFVSRSDLQRPPFRMLLFGLISLFEMQLLELVQQRYGDTEIGSVLNVNRLEKARRLHQDRSNRGEELHLADCLQIADKRDLLLACVDGAAWLGFESNKKAYRFFQRVEALRDRLVHANDLIAGSDWQELLDTTIELSDFLLRESEHTPTPSVERESETK
ncbi:hypothetical protein [Roseiconus nitratireducens]|nr:hypothetical protein [Roseiconus nitratireducens]